VHVAAAIADILIRKIVDELFEKKCLTS
jgi:hypothetical protein